MKNKRKKVRRLVFTAALLLAVILLAPLPSLISAEANPDPVLIIDAGHGGRDGGAVAPDGIRESDLNLDIALRLRALANFWGVDHVMTRETDDIEYPASAATISAMKKADQKARLELIHATANGILLSIHQNNYPASSPHGIQVFFGGEPDSDRLAAVLQKNLSTQLLPENRRVAEKIDDSVYLMRRANCRAVLVECGFLSNPQDLEKLETGSYRTELAAVMLASYLQYIRGTAL